MLACKHERSAFGSPMCEHLRVADAKGGIDYVRWYIGSDLDAELVCIPCAEKRKQRLHVDVVDVCEECFVHVTSGINCEDQIGGKPGIRVRPEPFNTSLKTTVLPKDLGAVIDIAPINHSHQSIWMTLADDGRIFRLNAETGEFAQVVRASVPAEPDHKPMFHDLRQRLHVSSRGEFVAVVNDYGRYGQVIDVRTGKVTLNLDCGKYYPETVPLSFAFADVDMRVIAIHRTEWNRLDFSDPASGKLLSERGPTSYQSAEERPAHYVDYFHGALYVSPLCTRIVDDGWIWAPVGVPASWSLGRWFSENVWESEDGPSRSLLCARNYYWDHGMCWVDESRVVVEGIGNDDMQMAEGARIFDVTELGKPDPHCRSDWKWTRELMAFAGPAGKFFTDGVSLFSSNKEGLSRWSIEDGARTGHLPQFQPVHHHRGTGELAQLNQTVLERWTIE